MVPLALTTEQIRELLRKICPVTYVDLDKNEAQVIIDRIDRNKIKPFKKSTSLHCWSADYMIDDNHYQISGEFSDPSTQTVMLVRPN
jgi:hypothetical protein